jgi:hypothetical protein
MEWTQFYNVTSYSQGNSLKQTSDGGYAITGEIQVGANYMIQLIKTAPEGTVEWTKTYDGDSGYSMVQTADGGYVIAGIKEDITYNGRFYLIKTSSDGTLLWNQTYNLGGDAYCRSLIATRDGGFALAGYNFKSDYYGSSCLVKTDANGVLQWSQNYNVTEDNYAASVIQTSDGGYALGGYTTLSPNLSTVPC